MHLLSFYKTGGRFTASPALKTHSITPRGGALPVQLRRYS